MTARILEKVAYRTFNELVRVIIYIFLNKISSLYIAKFCGIWSLGSYLKTGRKMAAVTIATSVRKNYFYIFFENHKTKVSV